MSWFSRKGPNAPNRWLPPSRREIIAKAQEENKDAIFHGACHDCAWKKGNNQGFGLQWCMGCAFFNFSPIRPNLRTPLYISPEEQSRLDADYYEEGDY